MDISKPIRFVRLALFVSALSCALLAQVDTGTVTGLIRDSSGQIITNAKITIKSESTDLTLELKSNDTGLFVSPPLRPSNYTVEVSANGFEKQAKRFRLDVSQRLDIDFTLLLGSVNQSVSVQDIEAPLQTESATLSNLRSEKSIKDLPLNGRNFAQLITLSAGAMPAQSQTTGSPITMKRGVTGYAINGTRLEENNFLVDGINNNENHNGLGIIIFPPVDAIQEFRVESSVANAQFGRGGGGTINLTYKSGGRDYHGGIFEFFRNSALDAKNYFDSPARSIPAFRLNQFGGFIGGRVNPKSADPKTFFFFDYQGQYVRQGQTYVSTVPTPAFKGGDFSAAPQFIFDPLSQTVDAQGRYTRQRFAGNRIPSNRIDPVGNNLVALFPEPNLPGVANNYLYNPNRSADQHDFDVKVDHRFTEYDTAWARYSWSKSNLTEPSYLPTPAVGAGPGVPGLNEQPVKQAVLSETHIFSPLSFNEMRLGFSRLNLRAFNPNFGNNVSQQVGIPGSNVAGDPLTSGLAGISISGSTGLGDSGSAPAVLVTQNIQWSDNFTRIAGRHTFKFGAEFRRLQYNAFQSSQPRGSLNFSTAYTSNPAAPNGTGLGYADLLLGRPASGGLNYVVGTRGFRRSELAFYAQDDVKVSSRLTLNLGLRYENFGGWPWTEVADRMYDFVPSTQMLSQVGRNGIPSSGVHGDFNNFGPRAGFAFQFNSKTVVRSAYGIFYSAPQLDVTRNLAANPPEGISTSFANDQFNFGSAVPASAGFFRPVSGNLTSAALNYIDPQSRTPYTQQWNISVQRELPGALTLTTSYVGTRGTKLESRPDINQPVPGTSSIASRRPFPLFQSILASQNRNNSVYHGLQMTAERRFAKGVGLQVAYTFSHAIDDASGNYIAPMNSYNLRLERASSDFDVRNRVVANWTWQLPINPKGFWKLPFGGWQLNGIVSLYSGLPFTVSSATNTLNTGGSSRASVVAGVQGELPVDQRSVSRWFNLNAFTAPSAQQYGNAGRNILRGPGTSQADLSLFKDFAFSPDAARRVQFRAEMFNVTNTPQFNNPNATVGTLTAGTIASAGAPLTFQRTSRQMQLALKLYF